MPGLLGTDQKDPAQTTQDFLGNESPVAFSSQPALPTGGPGAGGGASTAPPTIGGTGVGAPPAAPEGGGFSDLSGAALGGMELGVGGDSGQGDVGAAEGGQGPGFDFGMPSVDLASLFGVQSPVDVNVSPLGAQLGIRSGNQAVDQAVNQALSVGGKMAGVPTGASFLSLLSGVLGNPGVLAGFAGALSMIGAPVSALSLAHAIASMSETSVTTLQGLLANPNPEQQLTTEQALSIINNQQMGPVVGSPMTQGTLGYSPPNTATARSDAPAAAPAAVSDPVAEGFTAAEAAATGQGTSGPGPGPGAPGEGSGASGPGGDAAW